MEFSQIRRPRVPAKHLSRPLAGMGGDYPRIHFLGVYLAEPREELPQNHDLEFTEPLWRHCVSIYIHDASCRWALGRQR